MKNNILILICSALALVACNNTYQKELGEVDGLISMVDEIEKSILSVDTSKAFGAKRQIAKDLKNLEEITDTLDRETAFKLDAIFSGKKKIYRFSSNYNNLLNKIDFSRSQLGNLKQDLENGIISKEKFNEYYQSEQASIMELSTLVNKSVNGIEEEIEKLQNNRSDIDQLFKKLGQKPEANDE